MHFDLDEDGTFLFPPATYGDGTAAAYVKFWLEVPISDSILGNITVGYAELMRKEAIATGIRWGAGYDKEHYAELHHPNRAREAAADLAREAAYEDFMGGWYANNPKEIKGQHTRLIARAAQLFFFSRVLNDEDQNSVLESTLTINGQDRTVRDIYSSYRLKHIRSHFQLPAVTSSELLLDIRLELQKLRG